MRVYQGEVRFEEVRTCPPGTCSPITSTLYTCTPSSASVVPCPHPLASHLSASQHATQLTVA
ncbi:hypothetical protein JB92DRAFT_3055211 [Gautieria morchelliformis]|nr:hypothetical protein JB92DRAFT_3055211 [Gautieria morchelliformis]